MKNNIRVLVGCVVLLPQVLTWLALRISCRGGIIAADLLRYKSIKGLEQKNNLWAFVFLMMVYPEFRSVFYWRLGKLGRFVFFWMPGRSNLYLVTNPRNVGGGFYVGHGWGTVVNAQRIGRNFRVGQNVTVGSRNCKEAIIGDNVSVWANAIVLGDITVGDNCQVGAGAVVVKSIPNDSVVVPAKSMIIKQNGERVNIPL